jgi:hypothetical protein
MYIGQGPKMSLTGRRIFSVVEKTQVYVAYCAAENDVRGIEI